VACVKFKEGFEARAEVIINGGTIDYDSWDWDAEQ
jgi:hypothetical protein